MTEGEREDESVTHLKRQLLSPAGSQSHHPGETLHEFSKREKRRGWKRVPHPQTRDPVPRDRKEKEFGPPTQPGTAPPAPRSPHRPARQHPGGTHLRWLDGGRPATSPATLSRRGAACVGGRRRRCSRSRGRVGRPPAHQLIPGAPGGD